MRTRVSVIAAIAAMCAPSAAVAGSSPEAPEVAAPALPVEFAPDDPAFYTMPDPIPAGNHGDLIRFQVAESSFDTTYRIMYLSQTVAGAPTVVTGLVSANEDAAPFGGYRLLLHGHGTIGLADHCAPSQVFGSADDEYAQDFDSLSSATSKGFVVVSTDYEGLGGPGRHPFLVGISEGRSMLDAGLAARQIPGIYVGPVTAAVGFSQGGHAALWAAQLAPEWTPSQPIVATVVGAPSSEVGEFARRGAEQRETAPLSVSILAGLAASYPEAEAALGSVLTSSGAELIALMDQNCFDEEVAMPSGSLLSADPTTVEPFATLLAANTAGAVATPSPLLIFHGDADQNVPLAHSDSLLARLCAAGQMVERRVVAEGPHFAAAIGAYQEGVDWLAAVADGTAVPSSSCLG